MRRIRKFTKYILCFFVFLILATIKGCGDNQSNKVIYVGGLKVVLYYYDLSPNPPALDFWNVSQDSEGRDITRIAYCYVLQLVDENREPYHQAGIRIDIEVTGHGSIAGFGDIWETYGFLICHPEEGSGMHDGVLHGRTNERGRLFGILGSGDPQGIFDPNDPLDYNYKLPGPGGTYNDVFDTWVELKISVLRKSVLPIQPAYVWATFIRAQYQNMWAPAGGVYGNSNSGLGQWPYKDIMMQNSFEAETFDIPYIEKTPKDGKEKYQKIGLGNKALTTTVLFDSNGLELSSLDLTQLRWDYVEPWGWGWYYFLIQPGENLRAMWVDPNDPNEVKDALSLTEPYAYFIDITFDEPFLKDVEFSTVHLRAIDNNVVSKIPYPLYFYGKSPDNKTLTFMSWFLISEDSGFQGQYEDKWGNPYTVFYMPEGSYPDITLSEPFGDFNADDTVDNKDLASLCEHWLASLETETVGSGNYDLIYDSNNWDGSIDFKDFSSFAENWLWGLDKGF